MVKISGKFIFLFLLFIPTIFSQTTYEPLYKNVYSFLSRIAQKGIIELDDQIKPISRKYIAGKLTESDSLKLDLTELEREELEFYKKEFYLELNFGSLSEKDTKAINFISKDRGGRFRFFSYYDPLFKINADPIIGFRAGIRDKEKLTHYWSGLSFYGYISDYIGFSFDYRDNHEAGNTIDYERKFTPETGISPIITSPNTIDYSEIHTNISVGWKWGEFTAGKDFLNWGYGKSGKLVLSSKAPSFPFIKLNIYPVPWLRFNYFHGWLSSNIVDSTDVYPSFVQGLPRISYRSKYIASHTLTINPFPGFDISLGESMVYSDKLQIAYLMPLMFFKLADHYLENGDNRVGNNAQFFGGISSRNQIKNTHLYTTLFIDEISIDKFFNTQKAHNQLGITIGGSIVDLPVSNLTSTIEYTRINPFVYQHFIPTDTYENAGYVLGHWMENNGAQIYTSFNYRGIRGLELTIWGEYIKKGEEINPEYGWSLDSLKQQSYPNFLSGLRTNYLYGGIDIKYEFIHNLFARFKFQTIRIESEISRGSFTTNSLNELYFYFYYGM